MDVTSRHTYWVSGTHKNFLVFPSERPGFFGVWGEGVLGADPELAAPKGDANSGSGGGVVGKRGGHINGYVTD